MIFVTVGTQLPFDRLIKKIDLLSNQINHKIVAQSGLSKYIPENIDIHETLSDVEFVNYIKKAEIIIAHAGMGTIISCLKEGKKVIVVPRLSKFNEHRNDHQIDTCLEVQHFEGVSVCLDLECIYEVLNQVMSEESPQAIGEFARSDVLDRLKDVL